jgi:membrane protein YdbS with pleckstrin-like domain
MNCPKCRAEIEADSKFCKKCGAPVESTAGAATAVAASPVDAPVSGGAARAADPYRDPALEKQVWRGRPAWRAYLGTWGLWLAGCVILLTLVHKWTESGPTARTIAWVLILASAIVLLVRQALVIGGQQYRLTTQRLFLHHGILTRITDQMELVRVDDVRLRQGLIDRMVNTGDLEILSSDETDDKLILHSIFAPAEVAEHVRHSVRAVRGKGMLFVENV